MSAHQRYIRYRKNELYHFNPYHDKASGRFTSARSGIVYGSAKPSKKEPVNEYDHTKSDKSPLAYLAVNLALDVALVRPISFAVDITRVGAATTATVREHNYKKRKAKLEVDEKTGLPLKNKEWTEKQDLKAVNPGFWNLDNNTKNNCVLCSMALELRHRGYDVAANKASEGYYEKDQKRWFPKVDYKNYGFKVDDFPKVKDAKDPTAALLKSTRTANKKKRYELAERMLTDMRKEPDGSRGFVTVTWRGLRGGHAMYYKKNNGEVRIYDGQTGKEYKNPHKILDNGCNFSYARSDNLKFDEKTIKEVCL